MIPSIPSLSYGTSSGLSTGLTNTVSTNINGNFNANLGEILQALNQGSITNGGLPFIVPSAISNNPTPGGPGSFLSFNSPGFAGTGISGTTMLLIGGAVVAFIMLRKR